MKIDPDAGRIYLDSEECCAAVRRKTGSVALLAFSRGKDAIATWLQLRRYFDEVRPIWFYLVPGLEFEEESISYSSGCSSRRS